MPNPSKCVHIMLEVDKLDDVGGALDTVRQAQGPAVGPPWDASSMNDQMVSLLREFARRQRAWSSAPKASQVDDARWVARQEHGGLSIWGHVFGGQ